MIKPKISVIGLGYVGLPVSIAFDDAGYEVVGFDLNKERIEELKNNFDKTNEIKKNRLTDCNINFTSDESNFILFEPNFGWHRGTHVQTGERIALQVIMKPNDK